MSNNADGFIVVPVPDYQSLMLPVLRLLADREEHALSALRCQIAEALNLSSEELAERLASGSQTIFTNRIAWAIQYLKNAGAIEAARRAVYRITDRGTFLLSTNPEDITSENLQQFPEFLEFQGRNSLDSEYADAPDPELKDTPEESLERSLELQQEKLAGELLETIRNGTPAAFEKLVVDLLMALGYGSRKDAGRVVGKSGDGGIDGEVDQDRLGLETVYIQAKRWADVVGTPEIMKFSGGLTKKHASKGVFITSSGFTRDAHEYVRALPQKIVLIDGKRLASLMIESNVGVVRDKTYELKRLDQAYFDDL